MRPLTTPSADTADPRPVETAPAEPSAPLLTVPAPAREHQAAPTGISLRLRLTLWNVAILLVVLVLFGVSVFGILYLTLQNEINESLPQQYNQIRDSTLFTEVRDLSGRTWPFTNLRPDNFGSDQLDVYVQIATLSGTVPEWGRSSNLSGRTLPLSPEVLEVVRGGNVVMDNEVIVDGQKMRLYSGPLLSNRPGERSPNIIGVIQVARALDRVEQTMALLRAVLVSMGGASVVVAAVAGLLVTGRALAPLARLSQTARAIGASRDFSRRVEVQARDAEVKRLAETVNEMLGQLQAAHNQLATTLETQRRFVADASHELRTPLTTIRGNVGLLRRVADVDPEDRSAALADIDSEAERMSRLVSQLLSLARADAGAGVLLAPLDLMPLVEDSGRQLMVLAHAAGLTALVGPVDPVWVNGDADGLRQLLLALIDNAVKYTPAPGVVRLRLSRQDDAAVIELSDTGIGIAPADQERIFERFFRADPARSGGGAGLGLAIARWLAEAHGGRIEVDSELGSGSTFRVRLPVLATEPPAA
jgi:signal transduction histidine kinase